MLIGAMQEAVYEGGGEKEAQISLTVQRSLFCNTTINAQLLNQKHMKKTESTEEVCRVAVLANASGVYLYEV